MPVDILMPALSPTMEEGVLAKWLVKVGDEIKSGDVIAEIETDKATMEVMPYVDGTLLYIGVEKGKGVPVNGIMAIIGKPGEDFQSILNAEGGGSSAPAATASARCRTVSSDRFPISVRSTHWCSASAQKPPDSPAHPRVSAEFPPASTAPPAARTAARTRAS